MRRWGEQGTLRNPPRPAGLVRRMAESKNTRRLAREQFAAMLHAYTLSGEAA
jgi:hypothetical protein